MNPEEFREAGHQLIDWIADYRSNLEQMPVRAQVEPGEVAAKFPTTPPEEIADFERLIEQLEQAILPGITQVQHPMHFGWFPSNASLASVLGDIASSGLGTIGISWESCPALTEVEQVVCDWMRQLTGLSDKWEGVINDTASTSCLTAMMLARERASGYSQNKGGFQGLQQPLVVYTTEEAHSSVTKAALLAGFGNDNVRMVPMNPEDRSMDVVELARMVDQDLSERRIPAAIVASIGSTGVTAIDPLDDIVEIAQQHGIWVHVDAAMAGTAMLLPECRTLWRGVEQADSISWNPHKWMGTILDCSLFYVCDVQHLVRTMSTNPSYLRSTVDGDVVQYRDWGIPLGRRFRALKVLFHLQIDGIESIRGRIRQDLEDARWFAEQVASEPDWRVVAPVRLQTICIRHEPEGLDGEALNEHNLAWVNAINRSGKAFMSPAMLNGQWMVRISVGVENGSREHLESLWKMIRDRVTKS